ncbi:MAG TPA: DegT/DnrJ/EryC1/StrS family aminotransferase [Bryobacteraceae bacterium]|nr:DegT/DnrJ/EryC1/StrS family aminotransferase [Bryobacteraceae bacterium]
MSELALFGGPRAVTIERDFQWPIAGEEEIAEVTAMLRTGTLSDTGYGDAIRRFEEACAGWLDMPFALSRVDGTAALHSACFAAGIGPGDEVIVQSYTWVATAGCILACGAVPVFADIDPRTYTLDSGDVERRITPRTKAIVVVHLWGHMADMDPIRAIAARHGLVVIEDAAHAHGATYKGRQAGTIGDIGCFSFQATKGLPAGEGGLVVTRERKYFERALLLAQSPGRLKLHIELPEHKPFVDTGFSAYKYRINPLNAVIGYHQLRRLEHYNAIRQRNLDHLTGQLEDVPGVRPPYTSPDVTRGAYYGYPILYMPDELGGLPIETFLAAMQAEGVALAPERYPMLHLAALYQQRNPLLGNWPWSYSDETRNVAYSQGDLPVTEEVHPRLLAIQAWDKATPCEDLFHEYAQAFRKVAAASDRLQKTQLSHD